MNFDNFVFVTVGGWTRWSDGALEEMEPWGRVKGITLVVTDFEEAPMGCYRFDGGKGAYALPMIEKRARAEGVIEGVAHIVAHEVLPAADGFQTFHTAVALEFWQRLQQWATQQRDHCLVMPLGALLADRLGPLQARVVRLERTFHCHMHTSAGPAYVCATAVSDRIDDMRTAVRVLAGLTRIDLGRGVKAPVQWVNLLLQDEASEGILLAEWNDSAVLHGVPVRPARTADNVSAVSVAGLIALLSDTGIGGAVNPPLQRFAWQSERFVLPAAVVCTALAVGLFTLGAYFHGESAKQHDANARFRTELAQLESRIAKVSSEQPNPGYLAVASFASKLGDGARFDPVPMLALLRNAASDDIDIKRLRLEGSTDGAHSFRVDGVMASSDVLSMGRFVSRLRQAGWTTQPLEPADTAAGAFSYRLVASGIAGTDRPGAF